MTIFLISGLCALAIVAFFIIDYVVDIKKKCFCEKHKY